MTAKWLITCMSNLSKEVVLETVILGNMSLLISSCLEEERGAMFGKMLPLLLLFYKHVFSSPTPFSSSPLWVKVMPAAIPRSVVAKSFCLLSEPSSRWLHTMNPWEEVRRQFVPTQVSLSHFACSSLEFCQFYLCWKKARKAGGIRNCSLNLREALLLILG